MLASQDGVVTRRQALAAGMSSAAIGRRVSGGEWQQLAAGVFLRADRPMTPAVRLRAAVYSAGADAAAFGPSAAWWWGLLERPPTENWVTVPRGRCVASMPDRRLRRRDLRRSDLRDRRELTVTDLPLTVLEAAVVLPNGAAVIDRAIQTGRVLLSVLERVHERNLPRHGSARAAALLRAAAEGGHSEAERMLLRLLRSAGLTGWQAHFHSCGYEIDVAFPRERVAIEVDGWAWHRDVERFNRDAHRQNVLIGAGWRVLRFTWHQLDGDPQGVLAEVRRAVQDSSR